MTLSLIDDYYELEQVLPCGDWLVSSSNMHGGRIYYLKTNDVYLPIWNPDKVHRVALQAAILKEDEYKYKEKRREDDTIKEGD